MYTYAWVHMYTLYFRLYTDINMLLWRLLPRGRTEQTVLNSLSPKLTMLYLVYSAAENKQDFSKAVFVNVNKCSRIILQEWPKWAGFWTVIKPLKLFHLT